MGKTSDELRDWMRRARADEHMDLRELDSIAYCIDAEMVELPRDKDGVIIRIGDTIYDECGYARNVRGTVLNDKGWVVIVSLCEDQKSRSITQWLHPTDFTHTRPDSWERIAYDIETVFPIDDEDNKRFRHELADRIRKLAKEGE